MARKLSFGVPIRAKPLVTWKAKGRKAPALLYVLSANDFERAAKKHGYKTKIGAFAVWGGDLQKNAIYLRYNRLDLFGHEWRHIETQSNFHEGDHS